MDDRVREASDPTTPPLRLMELATGNPGNPWTVAARKNPSLPTSGLVQLLAISGLAIWQNPSIELLFLQGIFPYQQASLRLPALMKDNDEVFRGVSPSLEPGTKALPYLADALQGWWLNAAKIRTVVQHFANALHLAQRKPDWFAGQAHIEMIEMMATCLLSNKRLRGDLGEGLVRRVLARIQTKKYRTKGIDIKPGHGVSGIDDLIKMARGDMKGRDVDLYWFVQNMTTAGPSPLISESMHRKQLATEEAAMLQALRERWPTFPLLRFVP